MTETIVSVNEDVMKECANLRIPSDILGSALLVLTALYNENYVLLDMFDDENRNRRAIHLYNYLVNKELIAETMESSDVNYKLTYKGVSFVENVLQHVKSSPLRIEEEKVVKKEVKLSTDIEDWIEEWIKLFPKEKVGGRYLRTNKGECIARMDWFMKNHSYDRDTIFRATKHYLKTQQESPSGFMYARNSTYFISKQVGRGSNEKVSDLATWCEIVSEDGFNETEDSNDVFNKLI